MPNVCRKNDPLTTGHICAATTILDTPAQGTVYANGILVARETDPTVAHPFPPSPPCAPHVAVVNKGSLNVFVVGLPVARVTDSTDAGAMTAGSPNVYDNGV
jgi:uncharacterized Zn-binding protein involved in type VI secretion